MRLLFIRLRNVKSYGEGTDGTGVVVRLQPGVNRIAGRNGHGKSTLIEAVGYALFLANPVFEENFQAQTYLLRAGEKTGEIEIAFEHRGEAYRVVRSLGARNPVRDKVVGEADGSIAAEGRAEVDAFLCRLFRVPEGERLREMFGKLLGVKQGRLAWPFDSKPAEARRHFEPLLDVDVFRDCFDRLKPVGDRFGELTVERQLHLEGVSARIRERAASPAEWERWSTETGRLEHELERARGAETVARSECAGWETRENSWRSAEKAAAEATSVRALADQRRITAARALEESRRAVSVLAENREAYQTFEAAELALTELQRRRTEKERWEKEIHQTAARRLAAAGRVESNQRQAALLAEQGVGKIAALTGQRAEEERLTRGLAEGETDHEFRRRRIESARAAATALQQWRQELAKLTDRARRESGRLREDMTRWAAWVPERPAAARVVEQGARAAWEEAERQWAAARQGREMLARQLAEIRGGVCPFLKESCRQFDPARVGQDLATAEARIVTLAKERDEALVRWKEATRAMEVLTKEETVLGPLRESIERRTCELRREFDEWFPAEAARNAQAAEAVLGAGAPVPPWVTGRPVFPEAGSGSVDVIALDTERGRWLEKVGAYVDEVVAALDQAREKFTALDSERSRGRERIRHLRELGLALDREIEGLALQRTEALRRAEVDAAEIVELDRRIEELRLTLLPFGSLADEMAAQQAAKLAHAEGYRAFLGARDLAALIEARAAADRESAEALVAAVEALTRVELVLTSARADFDAGELARARQRITETAAAVRGLETSLTSVRTQRDREASRMQELATAQGEESGLREQIARLAAARRLNEGARKLLRDAAPRVAQRICDRLAARARQIFHRLHSEAVELAWSADNYSLRIEPGERRFAMLSGGEQTKLALCLTLAMIREFSDLRFCIFDEPTYGVDADSRQRLADAILEVQEAAEFEQVLLVSHDDAFEGRIEHVVHLTKSVTGGTTVRDTVI